ncbi:MAG: hypothetical protein LBE56_01470 [Tannerella sp.]|jgi:hypothetical protein|nr:hypothetical protein [Tannerella sp.]
MLKIRNIVLYVGIISCFSAVLTAQNSTSSPYTRYGYGIIADHSFGAGRSMGGIGYGLRSSKQINPMNPASYTAMDSLTFLFDAGATVQLSLLNDAENSHRNFNGNIQFLAMQFPLSRRIAMSAGVLPYSHTGYVFNIVNEDDDITHADKYTGKGGLNEVFIGLSADLWKKRLSVGANVSYFFGRVEHYSIVDYISSEIGTLYTWKKANMNSFKYDFGLQYTHPLSRTQRMVFGLKYSPKVNLSAVYYDITASDEFFQSILIADTVRDTKFDIPNTLGFGVSYEKDNKLILAADVSFQDWSNAHYNGSNEYFRDKFKVAAGAEYIPNNFTRSYLSRVRYRAGLNYGNSYLKINDQGYNEYGVTVGAGFPMMDGRSYINASFEYVKVAPEADTLIDEQYFRFTLSFTFNEFWFFKRKIE